jgi:hypothetical protein
VVVPEPAVEATAKPARAPRRAAVKR